MDACLDLAYLVGVLGWFYKNFGLTHVQQVKHVRQYVSGASGLSLKFNKKVNILDNVVGYTDSDFTELKTYQKITRGYVFIFAGAVISYSFKLQTIVLLSTCEV